MGMFLRRGLAPHRTRMSDLEIGRSIKLNLSGTPWDWLVVHQGLPSEIYDESCNGTWLLLKNIYELRQWHSVNTNDYANSTIHSHLNSTFLALLDSDIQNAIKQVKIPYRAGSGYGKTVTSGASGLPCKVFLLSATEVAFNSEYAPTNEGGTLSYFDGSDAKRIAYLGTEKKNWWLRSPYCYYKNGQSYAVEVGENGNLYGYYCASQNTGVRPAIILPSNFIVTDDMLV